MQKQENVDYARIAKTITYLKDNFRDQPSLNELAKIVDLSPFHFQRLFTQWAGVSPKKFIQFISLEYAKQQIIENPTSLRETAYEIGLSGSSRLHDLFIRIEGMTPGEYKQGGAGLTIDYHSTMTPFGHVLIANTLKGICHMSFEQNKLNSLFQLKQRFPNAEFSQNSTKIQKNALKIFLSDWNNIDQIKLHLHGTPFQLQVWACLLKIPMGHLVTYQSIAEDINKPQASRAIGTAIGKNPIAFLIPCHRVIRSTGVLGGYMWGLTRKSAIIGWEASQAYRE